MKYNWQHPLWPKFQYSLTSIQNTLYNYAQESGLLSGAINQLPDCSITDTIIDLMVIEALKTSEIEGEILFEEDVRSSIKMNLDLPSVKTVVHDDRAKGVAELMLDVRDTFNQPLTKEKLFEWHIMIMKGSSYSKEEIGCWRQNKEPMQIVSGPIGKEKIHFEAPCFKNLDYEIDRFLEWFNDTHPKTTQVFIPGPVRAAIAHLHFESIHPFIDGNGRIGRAIVEKVLAQDIGSPILFSLSSTIQADRKAYYNMLQLSSGYSLEISDWIEFFVNLVCQSQLHSKEKILFVLKKTKFWRTYQNLLNGRQEKVIHRMLKEGLSGFKGGMSAKKYMTIADCSKATATRDLTELLRMNCFYRLPGEGPNTRYNINI